MQGLRPLSRYFDFKGRSGRAEYWQWFALSTGCGWIVQALQATAEPMFGTPASLMTAIYAAATIIPQFSVATRRLHDRGRSGWWQAAPIVILILAIALLAKGRIVIDQTGDRTEFTGGLILLGGALIGAIAFLIECARPGDVSANKYGPPDQHGAGPSPQAPSDPRASLLTVQPTVPTQPAEQLAYADLVSQLDQLDDLRRRGVLDYDEFKAAKKRVLDTEPSPLPAVGNWPVPPVERARPSPSGWQPTSKNWQERFAFYDQHGLPFSAEQRTALSALDNGKSVRILQSLLGFVFGPFYFLYLGLWRPVLVLAIGSIIFGWITSPVMESLLPTSPNRPLSFYDQFLIIASCEIDAFTVIPLYYLQQRYGIRTWNPFRRSVANG